MRGLALFMTFAAARVAVIWNHSTDWTPAMVVACAGQDAIVATVFLGVERVAQAARWSRPAVTALFWLLVAYTAINVVVARVLSTPLTWPMLRATGGPISDSIWFYLNWRAVFLIAFVSVAALVSVRLLRLVPRRVQWATAALVTGCGVLGTIAERQVDTHGYHRNAVATLVTTSLPVVEARVGDRDWRESPFGAVPPGRLPAWHGAGAARNVVLIGLESTGAQYLRTFGGRDAVMPKLGALAASALVFDRAYAVSPDSIRSLFSVLCSRYPAFDTTPEAYAATPCASIAERFRDVGYRTALFHSGRFGYLGMESVVRRRGFDVLEDAGDIGGNHQSSFGVDEPAAVARILEWIDGLAPRDRFFVHYLPVAGHHPYEAPAPGAFGAATDLDRYRSALHDGDQSLGALIDGLRARGMYENTVFVVYGDHGQAFGQHEGNFGHTFFLYDENVRVPFLVAVPGVIRDQVRSNAVVSLIDVAPTLAEVMGFEPDSRQQGRSVLDGESRMALFFTDYGANLVGLRDGRWKFIHELASSRSSLFDLEADPAEQRDVRSEHTDRAAAYQQALQAWSAAEKARMAEDVGVQEDVGRVLRTRLPTRSRE